MPEAKGAGLKKETAAALSYVLGPITGVIFLLLEKDPFVRFHAMQSIVVFGALVVLQWFFGATVILAVFAPLISLLGFVLWLYLIFQAAQGERWMVPYLGKISQKLLSQTTKNE